MSFDEAKSVFGDLLAFHTEDVVHEERMVMLGISEKHRVLYVVFEEIEDAFRIISARQTTKQERKAYEEN